MAIKKRPAEGGGSKRGRLSWPCLPCSWDPHGTSRRLRAVRARCHSALRACRRSRCRTDSRPSRPRVGWHRNHRGHTAARVQVAITTPELEEQTMKRQQIAFAFALVYLWVMMILLGSIVLETFMVYPNIFHDAPRSLETAMEFMAVSTPGDFFPTLGFLSWLTGIGTLIFGWRVKSARYWILISLMMIAFEGLFSMTFFWPRNTIMFTEGTEVHSDAYLKQIAQEFQTLHWSRLAFNAAGSASIFIGFLRFYRHLLTSQGTPPGG